MTILTSSRGRAPSAWRSCASIPDPLEAIFVPIGGGGLAAGIAVYVKFLRPEVKVIGVEPEDAASMAAALAAGERVILNQVGLFADGVAVRQAGRGDLSAVPRVARRDHHRQHRRDLRGRQGHLRGHARHRRAVRRRRPRRAEEVCGARRSASRQALVAINSGANMNFDRLRHIAERAELGEQREALLAVTIPEQPGSYRRFIQLLGKRSITEFNYRYADPRAAQIFVGVQLSRRRCGEAADHRACCGSRAIPCST